MVPAWLWSALALLLAAQLAWHGWRSVEPPGASDLGPPPRAAALRLASFGEPAAIARVAMLYLQTIDFSAGRALPYASLDYTRLVGWLDAILELDPRSDYPLFSAARVYAEVPDAARSRLALDFVYRAFLRDPDRRWPWLAHASLLAKHRLGDLPLALRYAAAIEHNAKAADVPLWARQMQIFILEDMNELEAAKVMIGGLLESGHLTDPAEARFLRQRLEELERRGAGSSDKKR